MNNMDDFKINVISGIDEEIIDRNTVARIRLTEKPKLNYRKKMMAVAALAATFILIIGGVLMALLPNNQVPVYEGMSVMGSNPMLTQGQASIPEANAQGPANNNGNGNNNGNNGNHYGNYKGDHVKDEDDIDQDSPYGDGNESISDVIKPSDLSPEAAQDMYYANPGEDVFVVVHINNPSGYEILSFTLNGQKYSNYMFEYGSDLENLILKVNVGDAQGVVEYTIDQIKYVDGTEIKDVKMEGDRTVRVGVRTDKQPTVTVTEFLSTLNSISFKATVTDELELIKKSSGKVQAVLYDGDTIVATKDITESVQTVVFDGLDKNTLYQYAILITYDDLSGEGVKGTVQGVNAVYTHNPLLFDNVEIGKTDISFAYIWYSELSERIITSVSLWKDGAKVRDIDITALTVDGLLSDNEYTLVAEYKMGDTTEKIELEFKTEAKLAPDIVISESSKTQTSIGFEITETDEDSVGAITKIELLHGSDAPIVAESLDVREFINLLSNNTYTVKVTYVYDLNDGNGEQTGSSISDIKTKAKAAPKIVFYNHSLTNGVFKCNFSVTDPDNTATLKSIKLFDGDTVIAETAISNSIEFALPESGDFPLVRISYEYDLNDGEGMHTGEAEVNTVIPSAGFEIKDGVIVGIGTCEDTILYIDRPIGEMAFSNNLNIEKVYLLAGATNVGYGAFYGCMRINYVYLGDGVKTLSVGAFDKCLSLKKVYVSSSVQLLGSFVECSNLNEVVFEENSQLVAFGTSCFSFCSALKGITVPDSVKRIDELAFMYSGIEFITFGENSSLTDIERLAFANCEKLKSIRIPNSVKTIGVEAFGCCSSMESIFIPGTVTSIGERAFDLCNKLTIFVDSEEIPEGWSNTMNPANRPLILNPKNITFKFESNGGSEISDFTGIFIPSPPESSRAGYILIGWYDNAELEGSAVKFPYYDTEKTTLYAKWFYMNGNSLSEGLETSGGIITGIGSCTDTVLYINQPIKSGAFKNNTTIEKIYFLPRTSYIEWGAFEGCANLKYVYIEEGITTIDAMLFKGCQSLEEVYIPASVTYIFDEAFSGCTQLKTVTFAENSVLSRIWPYAFYSCSSLKSISIPDKVLSIDRCAFESCGLESVYFSEGCKLNTIGEYAFQGCTNLEKLDIPNSVLLIKECAFWSCTSLKVVVIPKTVISIEASALYGFNDDFKIYTDASEWPSTWNEDIKPDNDHIVYSVEKRQYTFESNGGSIINGVNDYVIIHEPIPTKNDCIFMGWYDNEGLSGKPVKFPYYSAEKTTLYAKWLDTVNFNESDGLETDGITVSGMGTCQDTVLLINKPVDAYSFWGENSITTVIFGDGATSIGEMAFTECRGIVNVVFVGNTMPELGDELFTIEWYNDDFKIYVPEEMYDEFKSYSATWWQRNVISYDRLIAY